jgi:hypothetical protein
MWDGLVTRLILITPGFFVYFYLPRFKSSNYNQKIYNGSIKTQKRNIIIIPVVDYPCMFYHIIIIIGLLATLLALLLLSLLQRVTKRIYFVIL